MATITIAEQDRKLEDPQEILEFVRPFGIWYEKWDVDGRIGADATNEEILSAYEPEIERLKQQGGFQTADVINVNPDTPGLDEMLAKFDKEHTHSEDEVRFTIKGRGLFHIHPDNGPVFSVTVESGDLINVPEGTRHWFNLCENRSIRCIRLFKDKTGWAAHYIDDAVHGQHAAVCWGPDYLPPAEDLDSVVKV
jgi:1,2-dihydroxy-3-keto-5-methylthiopentene dioxygenase